MFQSASTSEAEYIIGHGKGSRSLLRNLYLTVDAAIGHDFAFPYGPSLQRYGRDNRS